MVDDLGRCLLNLGRKWEMEGLEVLVLMVVSVQPHAFQVEAPSPAGTPERLVPPPR